MRELRQRTADGGVLARLRARADQERRLPHHVAAAIRPKKGRKLHSRFAVLERRLWIGPRVACCCVLCCSRSRCAANGTVRLSAAELSVGEGDGAATIEVERTSGAGHGEVRYAVWHRSADYRLDYTPVRGRLDFADGQTRASFRVPIADDANVEGRESLAVGIYGAYPQALGAPTRATLTILDNDVVSGERDALNPLGLDPPPPPGNPLLGAPLVHEPRPRPGRHGDQADPSPQAGGRRSSCRRSPRSRKRSASARSTTSRAPRGRAVPRAGAGRAGRLGAASSATYASSTQRVRRLRRATRQEADRYKR